MRHPDPAYIFDIGVIGAGLVGAALSYGLARQGLAVAMLDEADVAFRSARGNFGNIWVQGKGAANPAYAVLTLRSADLWPDFARELEELTGIPIHYRRQGGVCFCYGKEELDVRARLLGKLRAALHTYDYEILGSAELQAYMPGVSAAVRGASISPYDGDVNPLLLLKALHKGFQTRGGTLLTGVTVAEVKRAGAVFELVVKSRGATVRCRKVVLAAGLGNAPLAAALGETAPVHPLRGQILVTERLEPMLDHTTSIARQTDAGTILIGDSEEEVGFDSGQTLAVMSTMAERAVRTFPRLRSAKVVRGWGCLRVMSPDGLPMYQRFAGAAGGVMLTTCHSGVTLAALHAVDLPLWVTEQSAFPAIASFSEARHHA